jgi:hypothetical protein
MNNYQSKSYELKQASETKQLIKVPASPVENPSDWIQDGTSPTEVILANAVLIVAISSVIIAIAYLAQVLVGSTKVE